MSAVVKPQTREDVQFGATYEDMVTGEQGVATAVATYITGCDNVGLSGQEKGARKVSWYDVPRVRLVREAGEDVKAMLAQQGSASVSNVTNPGDIDVNAVEGKVKTGGPQDVPFGAVDMEHPNLN